LPLFPALVLCSYKFITNISGCVVASACY